MHPYDRCRAESSPDLAPKPKKSQPPRRKTRKYRKDIFKAVNQEALPRFESLCRQWLPGGKLREKEWTALNPLRSDKNPGSFRVNVDTGRWAEFADPPAKGGDPISLFAYLEGISQIEAARILADELGVSQ